MKRFLSLLLTLLLTAALAIPSAALTDDEVMEQFSLTVSDPYTVLDRSNLSRNEAFLERLGYTVSTFRRAMEEGDIYLYAATEDNDRQVQVKSWGDREGIAQKLVDLSYLGDEEQKTALAEMGQQAAGSGELLESEILTRDGQVFFRYRVLTDVSLESDTEQIEYGFDEYLTVANGRFFALLYYNAQTSFTEAQEAESRALFDGFSVAPTEVRKNGFSLPLRIFSAVAVLAAAVVAVFLLSTLFRDFRLRREKPDTIPDRGKHSRKS